MTASFSGAKFATVNGIKICYEEAGEGKPIFLIHGLTSDRQSMKPMAGLLPEGYKAIAYDTRGHGESDKPSSYTLADHGPDLFGLMDALGYEKAVVIGHSMGSYIAAAAATQHPERIEKLILVATKTNGATSSVQRILGKLGMDVATATPEQMIAAIASATFAPMTPKSLIMEIMKLSAQAKQLSQEEKAAEAMSLNGFDLRPEYHKITTPTLVISGEFDGLNPPEWGEEAANLIPGAQYVLMKNVGHVMHMENPQEFTAIVREFLLG